MSWVYAGFFVKGNEMKAPKINTQYTSHNYDQRNAPIQMLVIHATATRNLEETLSYLIHSKAPNRVSAHYVIDRNGIIYGLVADKFRAWHAGISSWPDISQDINSVSIGIEFQCPVDDKTGSLKGFTMRQIQSGLRLCQYLCAQYHITPDHVVGHSDIAPGRKSDPGLSFPWERFVQAGLACNPQRR